MNVAKRPFPGLAALIVAAADWFRSLRGWRRAVAAIAAGGLASLSLPPGDALPLLWVAIPIFIWILESAQSRKAAFWLGWCFSFGYLAVSLYWLTFALFVAIDRYWWLVPFASNGLAAGLSFYFALGTMLATMLVARDRPLARCLVLVAMWSLAEWVRGHALTGFPWNLPGYAWTEYPWLIQNAAWIGIYGVTVLTLLAPALASLLGSRAASTATGRKATLAGLGMMAVAALFGFLRMPDGPTATVPGVRLRLVQPSIEQSLKWVDGRYDENLRRHIKLSLEPAAAMPNIIIWPEAAEPYPIDDHPDNARALGSMLKPGQLLATGIARDFLSANPPTFRDSLEVLDSKGDIVAVYDKFHYVPFGEYMPLSRWLPIVQAVAAGDIEPTEGPGPVTITIPGFPPVGPLICYEVIFPHDVVDEEHRPDWLIDVTNDGWFGRSAGPYQHFAMMRVRAVEEGLPLANAANDGISGVIDPYGRVIARLGLEAVGIVDSDLPVHIAKTLYAKIGDWAFFIMVLGLGVAGVLLSHAPARPRTKP
jgi:apolipoprotein N-acyltransferase